MLFMRRTRGRSNNSLLIMNNEYTFFVTLETIARSRLRHLPLCIAKVFQLHPLTTLEGKNTPSRLVFQWRLNLHVGGLVVEYLLEHRKLWLKVFVVFLNPFRQVPANRSRPVCSKTSTDHLGSLLFCPTACDTVIAQRIVAIPYRSFEISCLSHLQS
jgi:hypothetical protein